MRLVAPAPLALLLACAAKPAAERPPTPGDHLIPDAADLLIGIDLAAVMSSELYRRLEPRLTHPRSPLRWLSVARSCRIDPIAARLSLLAGFDRDHDAAVVLSGDGVGDPATLHCTTRVLARLLDRPFAIHAPDLPAPDTATVVATAVDPHTVVFATHAWSVPVHGLIHGEGTPVTARLAEPPFVRVDRTAPVWLAGATPPELCPPVQQSLAGCTQLIGQFYPTPDVHLRLDVLYPPDHTLADADIAELHGGFQAAGSLLGLDRDREALLAERRGDEVHLDLRLTTDHFASLVVFMELLAPSSRSEPDRTLIAIGSTYSFRAYRSRLADDGLSHVTHSRPCALLWREPESSFQALTREDELILVARAEGLAEIDCDGAPQTLAALEPARIFLHRGQPLTVDLDAIPAGQDFTVVPHLDDDAGNRLRDGERPAFTWSTSGAVTASGEPTVSGEQPFRATAPGRGTITARHGDLRRTITVTVVAP